MTAAQKIEDLQHEVRLLPWGGQVLVLDHGALIDAEEDAMLQALHSRSVGGIEAHLQKLAQKGPAKFLDTYYIGYGDKSIGDCGNGTVFIEGVSMLVAKAIQDWRLYNGQESSTRYIDFSVQSFMDPIGTTASNRFLEQLRSFYLEHMESVKNMFRELHPYQEEWDETAYEKAIKARAFDVMRGFLPAGATTNLAWSGNLRQMADGMMFLRHHPLLEVRDVAYHLHEALNAFYPHSFSQKQYPATEVYNKKWMREGYYFNPHEAAPSGGVELIHNGLNHTILSEYTEFMKERPEKTGLPRQIAECGTMTFRFNLDYGSFRDIQRHRGVAQRMPLLTTDRGFNRWYMENIPKDIATDAVEMHTEARSFEQEVSDDPYVRQYYIPMGFNTPNRLTGDLYALMYLVELRGTRFVHPTLRAVARKIGKIVEQKLQPYGHKVYLDENPDAFDVKRGTQDIVEKK